ncbi:MAG: hypothetical protein KAS32_31325 [Candidatus Peribacteraceae bacterium]|nr:hypothetical protein [Candidatus Peribacteraceae bacterium]
MSNAPVGQELYITIRQAKDGIEVWINGEVMDKETNSAVVLLAGEEPDKSQSVMVGSIEHQAVSVANMLASYPPELLKAIFELMGAIAIEDDDFDGDVYPNTSHS